MDQNHPMFAMFSNSRKKMEEQLYQNEKSFLTPSWREVTHKDDVHQYMVSLATGLAQHVVACTCPQCETCGGARAQFCTPDLFITMVRKRLAIFNPENAPEAQDLSAMWESRRNDPTISNDPRYIMFRCNWDEILVAAYILRECTQDVFANSGIAVE